MVDHSRVATAARALAGGGVARDLSSAQREITASFSRATLDHAPPLIPFLVALPFAPR